VTTAHKSQLLLITHNYYFMILLTANFNNHTAHLVRNFFERTQYYWLDLVHYVSLIRVGLVGALNAVFNILQLVSIWPYV
jgi:uncharacterized membrane protein YiaA